MKIVDYPPPGLAIIEQTADRIVQLRKTSDGVSIDVWLRQIVSVRPHQAWRLVLLTRRGSIKDSL